MSKGKHKPSKFKRPFRQHTFFMGNLAKKLKELLSTEEYTELNSFIESEIGSAKKKATDQAVEYVWALMFRILQDKFEWDEDRLRKLWDYAQTYSVDIEKGEITLDEIVETLHEEGFTLN